MQKIKDVKVYYDDWKKLDTLKRDLEKKSMAEVIKYLLEKNG